MAYYTDSPAFQMMWNKAMGGSTDYRPLGLSGIANPRVKKSALVAPPKPQAKPAGQPINRPAHNPYAFNVVSSATSNAPGGGDTFGTMGVGKAQEQNLASEMQARGQDAAQQNALMNKAMSPAQVAAGSAPVQAKAAVPIQAKPAVKKVAAKPAPRNLLQSREPGAGFGGIRPMMNFGR